MASTALVTGKCGIDSAASVKNFTGVQSIEFNCAQNLVTITQTGSPASPVPIAIAAGATISLTNTGGNYVLSIT